MIDRIASLRSLRPVTIALTLVAVGMISFALARHEVPEAAGKNEYLSQEVQPDAMVPTLNDLDAQGWEVFQVVPIWKVESFNGDSSLIPKSYQVFGRRPVAAK